MNKLRNLIDSNESVIWEGKPNKKCFILESIFNPLLPFAIVWALFDSAFIFGFTHFGDEASSATGNTFFSVFLIPFFALHLMPVWIYLAGILFSFRKYSHTEYLVTDKGVYVSGGIFSYTTLMKPYTDLGPVSTHQGIFDQMLGVGDVIMHSVSGVNSNTSQIRINGQIINQGIHICDISDFNELFLKIKKLQTDIYADTMYPNDLRPKENHGYKTKYKGM